MPAPRLVPVAPTQGAPTAVDRSPFWIGSASSSALRLYLPGIAEKHASISEREDGYYLSPHSSATVVRLDGRPISGPTRLNDAAVIDLGPTARFEFVTGAPRAKPVVEEPAEPVYEGAPARKRPWWKRPRKPKSKKVGFPLWGWVAIVLIVAAVGYGGMVLYRILQTSGEEQGGPPPLTEIEGRIYDSLMVESTRNIERGATLLDLGLTDEALRQFAEAITILEASPIARNEWVAQSINTVAKTVQDIYQQARLRPPSGLRAATGKAFDLSKALSSNLTADQFQAAIVNVQTSFETNYQRKFTITGQDHAEHVSLYGPRSAIDIRVRDLTPPQIAFLIGAFGRAGIRVKDFSSDAVLQAQIQAAMARGWSDRAGTGLHLHVDRFRDRRDRWTVKQ